MNPKETAFLRQTEAHKGMLYKISRLYQDNVADQHDLFQEIMLQLWLSYDSFRGESQFSSWMYRVALNTALTFFKQDRKRPELFDVPYPDLAASLQPVQDRDEQLRIFHLAVQKLNRVEKALILLYLEDLPGKEIGEILGLSAVNVRVRLNRTKEKLKYIIKTMGYEF